MGRRFVNCRPTFISLLCHHQMREHWHTKEKPQGPCSQCGCRILYATKFSLRLPEMSGKRE